jgi:tetratricopeptide (TPR) repeat protein
MSWLRGAGLRGWLTALAVLCLLPAPIIAYDLLVSTMIYTIWPHWSHVALIFAGASVYALVAAGSLALASARGLGLLGQITERLPPAHSPQASVRRNAYLYIAGLLCLLPIPLIVSYGMAERSWLHLEGFRALAALTFWLTALSCVSFAIASSRRSLATIRAHVESFEPPSDAHREHDAAAGPRASLRGRALVGAGVLLLIAIPLVNYQQALYREGAHLGGLLGWAGRYEDALTAWEWAVRSNPDDANAHLGRGAMLAELGRYEEAVSALGRAIELDPSDAMAHYNRGWVLMKLGRYEQALRAFDEAIRLEPTNAMAHDVRGWALIELGRYEQALGAFDEAIRLEPADASAHYNRACSYSLLGMRDEALRDLKQAIELDGTLRQTARTDDDLAGLQGHPAFEQLVQVGGR